VLNGAKLILILCSLLLITGLTSCSAKEYPPDKAIANGDVVYFSETHNLDTFQRFIANVEAQQPDNIRITGTNNDPKISYFLLRTENELQTN